MIDSEKEKINKTLSNFLLGGMNVSILNEEGETLFDIIRNNNLNKTLEIGFAVGISTAYIMTATNNKHTVVDPYQKSLYHDYGISNLKMAGLYNKLNHINKSSCFALPELCERDEKYDFIFIDGSHLYDDAFLDFYYSDLLIKNNGYIIFHDEYLPAVKKVGKWIEKNKVCYIKIPVDNFNLTVWCKGNLKKVYKQRSWDHFFEF